MWIRKLLAFTIFAASYAGCIAYTFKVIGLDPREGILAATAGILFGALCAFLAWIRDLIVANRK